MDELVILGQAIALAALVYGACMCLMYADKYDSDTPVRSARNSRI